LLWMPEYSWKEVAQHNTNESAWVSIEDKVYDITGWLDKHPGGREYLEIGAGRDITYLFDSYHPFSTKPTEILKKYEIGTLTSHEFPVYKKDTGFYKECKEAVGQYFQKNKLHYKDPTGGIWRMAILLLIMYMTFRTTYFIELNTLPLLVRTISATIFGICQALLLIHMMHDACHSAIGYNQNWWKFFGRFPMDFLTGGDMKSWHHQHVVGHHVYTNVMGVDPDLPAEDEGDMRYIVPRQVWKTLYKNQWLYMPALYAGLALKVRIQNWTSTYLTLMNGSIRVNPISPYEWVYFVFTRIVNTFLLLGIPLLYGRLSFGQVMSCFLMQELALGAWLAFNFQVSHISTIAHFPCDKKLDENIAGEWAVLQVLSSVDYAHGNPLATFLSGALNYQTTHHLFPCVSQYHYPAITPIIEKICKKWKVPFNHFSTFKEAMGAHVEFLFEMGNPDVK